MMSLKIKSVLILLLLSEFCFGQIPILNSYPAIINKVIYLDFDGQSVSGTSWNSGNLINALPSTMTASNIVTIFKRVSEDYRPFDVNITTDSTRFNSAPANKRTRVVITPTSAWYGSAGGVAYIGSFTWGGTPGTPCWVFENMLGYSAKNIAEACSHEAGHTLTLRHQSTYTFSTPSCSKTAEYNPGTGTGVTGWAPIMGVSYYENVTTWYNGLSSTSCTLTQYDESASGIGLTSNGYLSFMPDDVGDVFSSAKVLNLNTAALADSGLIAQNSDIDAFKFTICNNRYVTIDVKPWALDTVNYSGANLDVRLFLYDASNNQLAVDTPLAKLNSRIGINLPPGTFWFTIDGGRSANYSDYGSLGRYYIKITAPNPPVMINSISTVSTICAGQAIPISYSSNGVPTQWTWLVNGPVSYTYNQQSPGIALSTGLYTLSLLASSSTSASCPATAVINVDALPPLAVSNSTGNLCPGHSATLTASGAASYTWLPGSLSGTMQTVSPLSATIYTIVASNGTCSTSSVIPITVSPDFTLTLAASVSNICIGKPVILTTNGTSAFTVNPGGISSSPAIIFPVSSTIFTVSGESSGCNKTTSVSVTVSQHFTFNVNASDTVLCTGASATLMASGATNYTFNPGSINGSIDIVNPGSSTIYTITGQMNGNTCMEDTTLLVVMKDCDFVGIQQTQPGDNSIRIYPNPAHGSFVIETESNANRIEIFNINGQLFAAQKMTGKPAQINTGAWAQGVYFVKLFSATGIFYTKKIVVE